jgi:SAM-dependent methyltransferase
VCPRCREGLKEAPGGADCPRCGAHYAELDGILHLVAGRSGEPGFDPHYFPTLAQVEPRHFWFLARGLIILEALRRVVPDLPERPLFDIGCGSGGLLSFLARSGVPVAGACDAYAAGLKLAHERLAARFILVDEGRLPPLGPGQRLIGMFDVLEHLDDDRGTLAWLASILEPGGVLVLTVPAHPFLFDEMDVLAFHRRRYRRAELGEKLRAAGLEVRVLTHFMAPLVPLLVVLRSLGRLLPQRWRSAPRRREAELRVIPLLNSLMAGVLAAERRLLRRIGLPFGTSLLAVAVRP